MDSRTQRLPDGFALGAGVWVVALTLSGGAAAQAARAGIGMQAQSANAETSVQAGTSTEAAAASTPPAPAAAPQGAETPRTAGPTNAVVATPANEAPAPTPELLSPPPPAPASHSNAGGSSDSALLAWPESVAKPPRHHNFYLRLNLGLVAQHAGFARETNSGGAAFAIAAGAAVTQAVVVFAEVNASGNNDVRGGSAGMLGAGVAYVWSELGVYVAGAIGPSRGVYRIDNGTRISTDSSGDRVVRDDTDKRDTAIGIGLSGYAGKEWLIEGGPFGLGLNAFARYSSLSGHDYSALGVMVSGTYY